MIVLPASPALNGALPSLIDFGGIMRPALGGKALKINRQGSRFRIACSLPPMPSDLGRVFVSRLLQGKREGLRIKFPLLGVDQGYPGNPVVDGANQAGLVLNVRGLTPAYAAREGFWLSLQDATGQHYLHVVRANSAATETGSMALPLEPALRVPFADGAKVNLAVPMIEGLVDGDEIGWGMSLAHHNSFDFTIEEAA